MCDVSDEIACSSPEECNSHCENDDGCTNIAYPLLVIRLLPGGRPIILTLSPALALSAAPGVILTLQYCTNVQSRRTFVQSRAEKRAVPSADKRILAVSAEALKKAWKIFSLAPPRSCVLAEAVQSNIGV